MTGKLNFKKLAGSLLAVGLLSATLMAEANAASRYDNQLQNAVTQKLAAKSQYNNVKTSVEDGIVTLTGTVDLYQRKLDAGKLARKTANAQGVRNLITVAGPNVTDEQLRTIIVNGGFAVGKSPLMPPNSDLEGKADVVEGLVGLVRSFGPQ